MRNYWKKRCGELQRALDVALAAVNEKAEEEATKHEVEHARKHFGQNVDEEPVVPYNDSCSDVLHLYLNIVKVAFAHVFHHPFQIEKREYKGEVKAFMSRLRDALNERMKKDFDNKQFGGEGTFALHVDEAVT